MDVEQAARQNPVEAASQELPSNSRRPLVNPSLSECRPARAIPLCSLRMPYSSKKPLFCRPKLVGRVVNMAVSTLGPSSTSSANPGQDGLEEEDAGLKRVEASDDCRSAPTASVVGGSAQGEHPNHGENSHPSFQQNLNHVNICAHFNSHLSTELHGIHCNFPYPQP